jgi:anti-sigma factor RsiW
MRPERQCGHLDEFLCGWLAPNEAAEFEKHFAECAACQSEAAVQRRIDRVLADDATRLDAIPAALTRRIERSISTARRRRRLASACGLAATVAGALAAGIWIVSAVGRHGGDDRPMAQGLAMPAAADLQPARVTLVDPSSAILVPVESHSPNVTLVCVYPTIRATGEGKTPPAE